MSYFQQILNNLLNQLEEENIPYCILHSYETLPEYASSDIDITIDPQKRKQLDSLLDKIAIETGFLIIQKLYYDIPYCYYFVLGKNFLSSMNVIKLDFLIDAHGINRYYLPSRTLLEKRFKYKNFYVPSFGIQTIYLLIKKAIKEKFLGEHLKKLQELYSSDKKEISLFLEKYFGKYVRTKILTAINERDIENIVLLIPQLKEVIEKRCARLLLKRKIWLVRRTISRALQPTGELVVILSPDGGGKSSVAKQSSKTLLGAFRSSEYLHWRPGVLPQIRTLIGRSKLENEFVITHPHNPKRRSRIISFLRWMYYTIDYIIGYYLKILPMKIRTTAVVMDRYYYDIVVDPVRYGFNLPQWLLKLPLRVVPKPDLTIYLDNEPEELYKRKQELPISELKRQAEAWREFIPLLPNVRIVTTDKPLEDVVHEVTKLIFERRAEMTRKMLKIDPDESKYLWKSEITNYIALPSKKNCRWIIPDNSRLAEKAFDLYLPYSTTRRIYKNLYRFISSNGLLKYLKHKRLDLGLVDKNETLKTILVDLFKRDDLVLAISTGTPGPFRKITAMILDSEAKVLGYAKIGETPLAIGRVKNEAKVLKLLVNSYQLMGIYYPECLFEGEIGNAYMVIQTPAPFEAKSGGKYFNDDYRNILKILIDNTSAKMKFNESEFYKGMKEGVPNYSLSYKDLLQYSLKRLEETIGNKEITFSLSHGDFAPWNMIWSKNGVQCFIFDWESAILEAPAGMDLIHFLFQTGFLLKKLRGKKLFNYILQNPFLSEYSFLPSDILLLFYCLHMAISEDLPQQLSPVAVERRRLIKLIS